MPYSIPYVCSLVFVKGGISCTMPATTPLLCSLCAFDYSCMSCTGTFGCIDKIDMYCNGINNCINNCYKTKTKTPVQEEIKR